MKTWLAVGLLLCMLTGCSAETFETLGPVDHVSATLPLKQQMVLSLPSDAAVLTISGEDTLYICDADTIALQTFPSGDLSGTIRMVSGYERNQLTVMESRCGDHDRYDLVWIAVGEAGEQVCRAAILDDGNYHYCITVMADASDAGSLTDRWTQLLGSFCLEN